MSWVHPWKVSQGAELMIILIDKWSSHCLIKPPCSPWLFHARSGWLRVWLGWLKLARTTLVLAQAAACWVNSVRSWTPLWMNSVQVCCSHIPWLPLLASPSECNRKSCTWTSEWEGDTEDTSFRSSLSFGVRQRQFIHTTFKCKKMTCKSVHSRGILTEMDAVQQHLDNLS